MPKNNIKFAELFDKIDQAAIKLLTKIDDDALEIELLKQENIELKEKLYKTLNQIEEYVLQLQQLKNDHINSHYKIK